MTRHFLNLADAGGDAIAAMLNDAIDRKAARQGHKQRDASNHTSKVQGPATLQISAPST